MTVPVDGKDHGQHAWFEGERPVRNAAPSDDVYYREGGEVVSAERTQATAAPDYEAFTVQAFPVVGSGAANLAQPTLMLSNDRTRKRAIITNNGAEAVRIGKLGQVANGGGYLLLAGKELNDIQIQAEVYVAVVEGKAVVCPVSVWCEFNR